MILNQETKNYFEENNYVVIKNFLQLKRVDNIVWWKIV